MPSLYHEALLQLFRNRPLLAPETLELALHQAVPAFTDARIESAELTDIKPAEYRADLVVLLLHDQPVLGIVVEVQLSRDEDKLFSWPVYAINLRARLRCPVTLLVIAVDESVARWASQPIDLGDNNYFTPRVVDPRSVPEIIDAKQAKRTLSWQSSQRWLTAATGMSTRQCRSHWPQWLGASISTLIARSCMLISFATRYRKLPAGHCKP